MNIEKYLTNKEVKITNSDFDIEALTKDIRAGFVDEKEVDNRIKVAVDTQLKASTTKYTLLSTPFNVSTKFNVEPLFSGTK